MLNLKHYFTKKLRVLRKNNLEIFMYATIEYILTEQPTIPFSI